jgi:hypothetical protein
MDDKLTALLDAVDDLKHCSMCARNVYENGECDCNLEPLDGLAAAVREEMALADAISDDAASSNRLADVCPGPDVCQTRIYELRRINADLIGPAGGRAVERRVREEK